jgi:hypothetical protein
VTPNDDELRARLRASDPMPDTVPTEPASGRPARELLEHIMQTDPSTRPAESAPAGTPWWRRPVPAVAAVAVVAALGVGTVIAVTGDDPAGTPADEPSVLALDGTGAQDPMAMCLQVTPENLAMFPIAFAGRAISVEDGAATLEVTNWYRGGDAEQVTIAAPPAQPALIGGVDIEVGGDYLITADEGTVSSCYFSDVATPELEALYADAFGS